MLLSCMGMLSPDAHNRQAVAAICLLRLKLAPIESFKTLLFNGKLRLRICGQGRRCGRHAADRGQVIHEPCVLRVDLPS